MSVHPVGTADGVVQTMIDAAARGQMLVRPFEKGRTEMGLNDHSFFREGSIVRVPIRTRDSLVCVC